MSFGDRLWDDEGFRVADKLTPDDFGPNRYGVHVSMDEDGDYLAYGHVDSQRLGAAINKEAREYGYRDKYFELTYADVKSHMEYRYLNNVVKNYNGEWRGKWCAFDAPGAVPVTKVNF